MATTTLAGASAVSHIWSEGIGVAAPTTASAYVAGLTPAWVADSGMKVAAGKVMAAKWC
ncbi:MAG: hypothetical protein SW127_15655 [Actinomycetota bacterium]|nr:hypothetical protein [Actinomycetota bacterium]